jgi:hypothetical protein
MTGLRHKICLLLLGFCFVAGCSASKQVRQAERPEWEPASAELTPLPDIRPPETEISRAMPPQPFDASNFVLELARLSSQAATEVTKLKAEAEIEEVFPDEAAAMLKEVADTLRLVAGSGYEPLETEIGGTYESFTREIGRIEDTIRLGESMEYVLARDVAGYYQLNSSQLNEMKKAYWDEKLKRLNAELAAERSRFCFAKQARLLTQAAEVGANQRRVINKLEEELNELALSYAVKVKDAIAEAASEIGAVTPPPVFPETELAGKVEDFEDEFIERFEKAKLITGG